MLKTFFRELPEPLLTHDFSGRFMDIAEAGDSLDALKHLRELIQNLPHAYASILRRLVQFLCAVVSHRQQNKMDSHNLALVFAPNLVPRHADISNAYKVLELMMD